MGVYINGIEMPKGADEHRLIIRANGQVIIDKKTYWEEAEAVPVPPHGDLIDREALRAEVKKHATPSDAWVFSFIRTAPTIIPAEGDET
jgi:hypothetical protein